MSWFENPYNDFEYEKITSQNRKAFNFRKKF